MRARLNRCSDAWQAGAPAAPNGLRALSGADRIVVQWDSNIEPDLVGYLVLRALPGARVVGLLVSLLYGSFVWSFATYPLRGLTPPPGQADTRQVDVASALVACVFLAAAMMILVGSRRREASSSR